MEALGPEIGFIELKLYSVYHNLQAERSSYYQYVRLKLPPGVYPVIIYVRRLQINNIVTRGIHKHRPSASHRFIGNIIGRHKSVRHTHGIRIAIPPHRTFIFSFPGNPHKWSFFKNFPVPFSVNPDFPVRHPVSILKLYPDIKCVRLTITIR